MTAKTEARPASPLMDMAVALARTVWGQPAAFVPPDVMTINGNDYRHCYDEPITASDILRPSVHVFYCEDTDEMELLTQAGAVAEVDQKRRDDIWDDLHYWLEEREVEAQEYAREVAEDRKCRECLESRATAPCVFGKGI